MNQMNAAITSNLSYIMIAIGIIFLIMLFVIILLKMDLSDMQKRYKKMMSGAEGSDLEKMLTEHAASMNKILSEQSRMSDEISAISNLLEKAITRVAVVRFDAFEDTGAELSYCIALLDDNNNGLIVSSIYGREESRSYAKAIVGGSSQNYKLTKEEEQALSEACGGRIKKFR